jgi:hypothetical protein
MGNHRFGWIVVLLLLLAGCSRSHYRLRADADTYQLLRQMSGNAPWDPPMSFDAVPNPASRNSLQSWPDDPALPIPAPQLYAYELPDFSPRGTDRLQPDQSTLAAPPPVVFNQVVATSPLRRLPAVDAVQFAIHTVSDNSAATFAELRWLVSQLETPDTESRRRATRTDSYSSTDQITQNVIPPFAWDDIPETCRRRMFDFESLREQFQLTYDRLPSEAEVDDSPRLTLEDIVDLALLNSREYQTQKETLYRVALRLSLERYDYQLKFGPTGNGTDVNYAHNRNGGITVNSLSVPSSVQAEKMLLTGGDLLARFANSVLLTFNGPQGFAADVSSDLLLNLTQSVFQRDIRFERLTQSERDVIYAARDFARFRKAFFTDLATDYYELIRDYRLIEIGSQNYFSFVSAFSQAEAEYRAGFVPRLQVDQVEQNLLGGRRRLTQSCNNLEQSLDRLKITIGVPTETLLNVDLTELNQLTLRDQFAVTRDLIDRVRDRLESERATASPNPFVLLSAVVDLIDRVLESNQLRGNLGLPALAVDELHLIRVQIEIDLLDLTARNRHTDLEAELDSASPSSDMIIFQRTIDFVEVLIELTDRQLEAAELLDRDADEIAEFRNLREAIIDDSDAVSKTLQDLINRSQLNELGDLVVRAGQLLSRVKQLVEALDLFNGTPSDELPPDVQLQQTLEQVDAMLARAEQLLADVSDGLVPIDIKVDDAMMTALVLRFELMNERGRLADDWRQIKLAADELKSVLNLSAAQTIRTRPVVNRGFDFTWDESRTDLRLSFDAPLNRRAQRNDYRNRLLNYQAGFRQLIALEDTIKFAIRSDLRSLALDKEQYAIDVASAALAFQRVDSTLLEFRYGGQVTARDIIEAQNDYTAALSGVANQHIGYIIDRMNLILDLELLTVNESGFWEELYDEDYQPEPYYQLPAWALPAYGHLPHVWYSRRVRRMLDVPPGNAMIHQPIDALPDVPPDALPEPLDPPALDDLALPPDPMP